MSRNSKLSGFASRDRLFWSLYPVPRAQYLFVFSGFQALRKSTILSVSGKPLTGLSTELCVIEGGFLLFTICTVSVPVAKADTCYAMASRGATDSQCAYIDK